MAKVFMDSVRLDTDSCLFPCVCVCVCACVPDVHEVILVYTLLSYMAMYLNHLGAKMLI